MTKCPSCFRPLPSEITVRCTGSCGPPQIRTGGVQREGTDRPTYTVSRSVPTRRGAAPALPDRCPGCTGPAHEICQRCRHHLPPGWRDSTVTCIAMAGARNTGKSVYLGVLLRQLEQLAERKDTTVMPADARTKEVYYDVFQEPLFERGDLLGPTPNVSQHDAREREPLVFSLAPRTGARHFLAIRDVSGEDLRSAAVDSERLAFFADADAVLFLFDPLTVPDLPGMVRGLVPARQGIEDDDPRLVLANVLQLIGRSAPRLGVVLSKFDVLHSLRSVQSVGWSRVMLNPGAAFTRERSWREPYHDGDGELLHEEVRSLLQRLHAGGLVAAVERAGEAHRLAHRFFAVSALGGAPSGMSLHTSGITPFRCLDPLRWAIAPHFRL